MDTVTDPVQAVKALKLLNRMPIWLIRVALPFLTWLGSRSTARYVLLIARRETVQKKFGLKCRERTIL